MATTRKPPASNDARKPPAGKAGSAKASTAKSAARATAGGPSHPGSAAAEAGDLPAAKMAATQAMVAAMPHNANKAGEHGEAAWRPQAGQTVDPGDPSVTASTLSESNDSAKVGSGTPPQGANPANASLDRSRVDSGGQALTTNMGVPISDNQNSLKAGLRGPALLEDFVLREKITHFDHERIPERIVHARGSGAHGYFECLEPLTDLTRASLFAEAGKRTPVFVRFSTVAGERGSTDTARDIRGFAVKFYTDEGNWDIVGNNIPVFFIQDAIKFPDLVHSVKPEPHNAMPQAASAHDTFWDFVSLMPESTHVLMWVMSDRGIPRSFRMMQGFGVHTFRFVNQQGESQFVKFHWEPREGTHSLVWDEAVKISGADSDFHRRDLWEAIEAGAYPEWELGVQVFTEEQAESFSFDVLDSTKIIPEELVPVRIIGRMVLNRNPDNFFAETEQIAFGTGNIVPGIDFSNDPLLAGRIHSYFDTQLSRLGGPNFHEIPINAPIAQVHNNQRDGIHRQAVPRGRVAYEPNSLGGGCPFQAGMRGFTSFRQPIEGDKVRGKPEKFADHYTQATLYWNSLSDAERAHTAGGFRFELSKVQVPAIRERMVASLANVHPDLARQVADGLGIAVPKPLPKALERPVKPEILKSPALSLLARPGDGTIRARRIAILVADGVDGKAAAALHRGLLEAGAVPHFVGIRLGSVKTDGEPLQAEVPLEAAPGVLFDAVAIPAGASVGILSRSGQALEFVVNQYRHCKPILAIGNGKDLLAEAGVTKAGGARKDVPGLLLAEPAQLDKSLQSFMQAIAAHRHFARESDPPVV